MIRWIIDHVGPVVFVVVAFSFVRKIREFLKGMESESERSRTRRPLASDPDEVRRVQEIQDEIRRKIAERRGGAQPVVRSAPTESRDLPPPIPTRRAPPIDPFGGPTRRIFQELERRLQPPPAPVQAPAQETRKAEVAAEMARQAQLAEQIRVLEAARVAAEHRAQDTRATLKSDSQSEQKLRTASRASLLLDLKNPASLRRAIILREVLGTPVGLR